MRKNRFIVVLLIVFVLLVALMGCRELNNPIDPEAANYQGYPTVETIDEVKLISPTNDDTIYHLNLLWSELVRADHYHIQISTTESNFEDGIVYENSNCAENSVDLSDLFLEEGIYYYKIRASVENKWTSWMEIKSFTGESLIESLSIYPENDGVVYSETLPLLDWDDAESIEGVSPAGSFQVQITDTPSSIDIAPLLQASSSQYQVDTPLSYLPYSWRVRPVTSDDLPGFWSDTWNFDVSLEIGGGGQAGGYVFYDKGSYSDGWRFMEAAPATTEWSGLEWGANGVNIPGADGTAIGTGKQNTADIITHLGSGSTYAAQLCDALILNGYDDWFLPSREELKLVYQNLYLQDVGDFTGHSYRSSSEYSVDDAWYVHFYSGNENYWHKWDTTLFFVRAVRVF